MTTAEDQKRERDLFTKTHALTAYRKVQNHRAYALDEKALTQLGATAVAFRDYELANNGRCDLDRLPKVYEQLAEFENSLRQNRPPPEPETPELPKDETTGETALNPWKKGSESLTDQMILEKRDPKLAAHLKQIAAGVSYSFLFQQRDERERRKKLRELRYDEGMHLNNVFRLSGREGLVAQSAFAKTHEHEPWLIDFLKREAQTPVSLHFDNLTTRMSIAKRDARLGEIYRKAAEIHAQWLREDVQKLKALIGENTAEIQQAEKQLAHAK